MGEMATHVAAAAGHLEVLEAAGPVDRGALRHHLRSHKKPSDLVDEHRASYSSSIPFISR